MPSPALDALALLRAADPADIAAGLSLAIRILERTVSGDLRSGIAEPASLAELAALRDQIMALAGPTSPDSSAAECVFALGKLYDPSLKPLFVHMLRRSLNSGAGPLLYQAMIALDNLDVPIFAGRAAMGMLDVEGNRALAAAFLDAGGETRS